MRFDMRARDVRPLGLLAGALLGLACQRERASEQGPAEARSSVAATAAPGTSGPPPTSPPQPVDATDGGAGAGQGGGAWVESKLYRIKLGEVKACGPSQRVGAVVSIESRGRGLEVSPRDVTLESGGVILSARFPPDDTLAGCSPALAV